MTPSGHQGAEREMKRIVTIFMTLSALLCFCASSAYSSWMEYAQVSYMDLTGDLNDEIIIKAKHGAGSNHYIEDIRIFQDKYPELDLIFQVSTLDSTFGFKGEMSKYNCNIISTVEFVEPDLKKGARNIIVKTNKIYYKDDENKVVDREMNLGAKIYKWNGNLFEELRQ